MYFPYMLENTDTDLNTKNANGKIEEKTYSERPNTVLVIDMNVNSEDMSLSRVGEGNIKAEHEKRGLTEDRRAHYEKVPTVKTINRKKTETKIMIDDEDIITLCDTSTKAVVRHNFLRRHSEGVCMLRQLNIVSLVCLLFQQIPRATMP